MGSKAPPIPPEQRATPGEKPHIRTDTEHGRGRGGAKDSRSANSRQNTHHSFQQDR